MGKSGPNFYDDATVFTTYMQHRQSATSPNTTIEQPLIRDLLGPAAGLRILDLGCGTAAFGRDLLAEGAARYVGVDGSENMIAAAIENLTGTDGEVILHRVEDWNYPAATFDCVLARLVLHYIEDLPALCQQISKTLVPGGQFICSIEHPVITSCDRGWAPGTQRQEWVVDDYFDTGVRVTTWLGGTVQKYHRTVADYYQTLQAAGLRVEQVAEGRPEREHFPDDQTFLRRKRIPLFLFFKARKSP